MSTAYTRSLATLLLALATFSGTLLDRTTGQPLTSVHVHAAGPSAADATTDAHGRFTLKSLQPGSYTVTIESNDVPPQTFKVTLAGNRITVLTMKACSTTLDYHCAGPASPNGPGAHRVLGDLGPPPAASPPWRGSSSGMRTRS